MAKSREVAAPEGKPPAGLEAPCVHCVRLVITTDNEPDARGTINILGPAGAEKLVPGWYVPCPNCGENVFFRKPEE